jgi:hypothetical protein
MESCTNTAPPTKPPSLEPKNLDPNHRDYVGDFVGFVKRKFTGDSTPTEPTLAPSPAVPTSSQSPTGVASPAPPPRRGLMDRLDPDVSWNKKKPSDPIVERPKAPTDTPTAKLLKVTGSRPLPTNAELNAFKGALTPDAFAELQAGLADGDWKVIVRAIAGLESYGQKFGWGTVAALKNEVEKYRVAPQASLRTAATRIYETIKDVQPTSPPEEPSAFDLSREAGGDDGEAAYDFAAG